MGDRAKFVLRYKTGYMVSNVLRSFGEIRAGTGGALPADPGVPGGFVAGRSLYAMGAVYTAEYGGNCDDRRVTAGAIAPYTRDAEDSGAGKARVTGDGSAAGSRCTGHDPAQPTLCGPR